MLIRIDAHYEVRSLTPADAPSLARHADDRGVWRNVRDHFPHPYRLEHAEAFIAATLTADPETTFAIARGAEAIGTISLRFGEDVFRRSAEIGYWIGREHWGRGIVTGAVRSVCDWAFERFDLIRIWAGVFAANPASARVLEKAGFELEGRLRSAVTKDGETLDQLVYARLRPAG